MKSFFNLTIIFNLINIINANENILSNFQKCITKIENATRIPTQDFFYPQSVASGPTYNVKVRAFLDENNKEKVEDLPWYKRSHYYSADELKEYGEKTTTQNSIALISPAVLRSYRFQIDPILPFDYIKKPGYLANGITNTNELGQGYIIYNGHLYPLNLSQILEKNRKEVGSITDSTAIHLEINLPKNNKISIKATLYPGKGTGTGKFQSKSLNEVAFVVEQTTDHKFNISINEKSKIPIHNKMIKQLLLSLAYHLNKQIERMVHSHEQYYFQLDFFNFYLPPYATVAAKDDYTEKAIQALNSSECLSIVESVKNVLPADPYLRSQEPYLMPSEMLLNKYNYNMHSLCAENRLRNNALPKFLK